MLQAFADLVAYKLFGLQSASHLGSALDFFIYDMIKIFLMLALIIFSGFPGSEFLSPGKDEKNPEQ